jgi:hypothetical protein
MDFEGAIVASDMGKLTPKLKADVIDLAVKDGKLIMKNGRARASFSLLQDSRVIPTQMNMAKTLTWSAIPDDFKEALAHCLIQKTNKNAAYDGVFIEGQYLYSTDGTRINVFTIEGNFPEVFLPMDAVKELIKFKGFTHYAVSESRFFVKLDNSSIVSCSLQDVSNFPKKGMLNFLKECENSEGWHTAVFPEELPAALERASILAGNNMELRGAPIVKLKFGKNIELSSENDHADYSEEVDWEESNAALSGMQLDFDASLFLYGIQHGTNKFRIRDEKKIIFEGENRMCVVAALGRSKYA